MPRARDLGVVVGRGEPGPNNAISDVPGVQVGYTTVIAGSDVRTGVTVIVPSNGTEPLFAGTHRLNGNGEMTGLQWVQESGILGSPIAITNTHSVGVVHSALVAQSIRAGYVSEGFTAWALPVVAETWDGVLNDINGFHVTAEHVAQALKDAHDGPIAEGNVGGGTGMICHGFKGGTGTASRVLAQDDGGYSVGVLVQANHGRRRRLQVNGVPVGEEIPPEEVPLPGQDVPQGSIIVVAATDAPLIPTQCDRLAKRAAMGIPRTGGLGEETSGDLILSFATGNRPVVELGSPPPRSVPLRMVQNMYIDALFEAVVEATEEAIVNALLAAETMTGAGGRTAYRLPPDRLVEVMKRYGRFS